MGEADDAFGVWIIEELLNAAKKEAPTRNFVSPLKVKAASGSN